MKLENRAYNNSARLAKAEELRLKMMTCAINLYRERGYDSFTLDDVASCAGTTVQTVLRKFGSKTTLIVEALRVSSIAHHGETLLGEATTDDLPKLVSELYDFYDRIGDAVLRNLADAFRLPELQEANEQGREGHRNWVAKTFANELAAESDPEREALFNAIMAATDIYLWQVLRRDQQLEPATADAAILRILRGLTKGE